YSYARSHHLSDVAVRNKSGQFVQPAYEAFRSAADATSWGSVESFRQMPSDPPGPQSWPITGASFILVAKRPENGETARAVLQFFDWALHAGGPTVRQLDYVPIPGQVLQQLPSVWGTIRDKDGKPVWP